MKMSATVRNRFETHEVILETNGNTQSLAIPSKTTGYGSAVNGGELLLAALGTCFCNDIYREAGKLNIDIQEVEVVVTGEFGAPGEAGYNFRYETKIVSNAPKSRIDDLIRHTDQVAEIHNTLRKGTSVTLVH